MMVTKYGYAAARESEPARCLTRDRMNGGADRHLPATLDTSIKTFFPRIYGYLYKSRDGKNYDLHRYFCPR